MKKRRLSFRGEVVKYMPYELLKFLIMEKLLTQFLDEMNAEYILHTASAKGYLNVLKRVHKLNAKERDLAYVKLDSITSIETIIYTKSICFRDAFEFNGYWHRRFWEYEEFLRTIYK